MILQPVILLPYCMYCVQLPKYITITLHFVTTFNQDSGNHDISDGNVHITIRNQLFLSVMIMLMRRGFRESGFSILLGWLPCPKPGCCTQTCSFTLVKTNAAIEVDDDLYIIGAVTKNEHFGQRNLLEPSGIF